MSSPQQPEPAQDSSSSASSTDPDGQQPVVPQITERQAKRLNTPIRAIIITMVALVGITIPFVWLQPHPDNQTYRPSVDVAQTAQEVKEDSGFTPVAPALAEPWHANYARWNTGAADGVPYWEIGYVTPSDAFVSVTQTNKSNPTWVAQHTDDSTVSGTVSMAGTTWQTRVHRDTKAKETKTAYVATVSGTTVILYGTGSESDVRQLAQAVVASAHGVRSATVSPSATASSSDGVTGV